MARSLIFFALIATAFGQVSPGAGSVTPGAGSFGNSNISVPLSITTTSLPSGTVGMAYGPSGAGVQIGTSGGVAPLTFSINSGALPPSMGLNSSGLVSGTPSSNASSPYCFVAKVTDSSVPTPQTALSGSLCITVASAITPIVITPNNGNSSPIAFSTGTVGATYAEKDLPISGGSTPYTCTQTGTIPPGLMVGTSNSPTTYCKITGTPTTTTGSPFTFTITVTDGAGDTPAVQQYLIAVNASTGTLAGDDNFYCPVSTNGTWPVTSPTWSPTDEYATLPLICLNTSDVNMPLGSPTG